MLPEPRVLVQRFVLSLTSGSLGWHFSLELRIPDSALGSNNVNPGLVHPWLNHRGVSPFSGGSSLLEGTPP